MKNSYDIIIVGAGLVGASLALHLRQFGLKVALLEKHVPTIDSKPADTRPLTLSYGSVQTLDHIDLWNDLAPQAQAIKTVQVSQQHYFGATRFTAQQMRLPALGYVVPYDRLYSLLWQRAVAAAELIQIDQLQSLSDKNNAVQLVYQSNGEQKKLSAALVVAADGSHSQTRHCAKIVSRYVGQAVYSYIAEMNLRHHHQYVAHQRFCRSGVMAFLPLWQKKVGRVVWTTADANVKQLQFEQLVNTTLSDYLGHIEQFNWLDQFSCQAQHAIKRVQGGVVLIGNAAHTIYPIAAQGFNLGLYEVATLCQLIDKKLSGALNANRDESTAIDSLFNANSQPLLEDFVRHTQKRVQSVTRLTQNSYDIFALDMPLLPRLRATALQLMDLFAPLKKRLAKKTMGLSIK